MSNVLDNSSLGNKMLRVLYCYYKGYGAMPKLKYVAVCDY
jgi:hypothetical protein